VGHPVWREDGSVIYRGHNQYYMSSTLTILHVGIINSKFSTSRVPCGYLLFTVLHVTIVYMYVQYIQRLCQSMLSAEDHVLTHGGVRES
jgi:hypothetical protein